jgi:hypothetical protein
LSIAILYPLATVALMLFGQSMVCAPSSGSVPEDDMTATRHRTQQRVVRHHIDKHLLLFVANNEHVLEAPENGVS